MYKFIVSILLAVFFIQDDPRISWERSYRLEWSDFKGAPKTNTSVVAITASGISFSYSAKKSDTELIDYNFDIKADFYPEKSWCLKHRVDSNILNHERLHFDITELYARKFRQRIKNTKFSIRINNQMEAIHDAINVELQEMQIKYDKETRHSQNLTKQKEWQANIVLQLNKLAYYGS